MSIIIVRIHRSKKSRIVLTFSRRFTALIRLRHVDALPSAALTRTLLESMMTLKFKNHWRTTTALCIASTIALAATTAYASGLGGLSNWDKRFHLNRFHK